MNPRHLIPPHRFKRHDDCTIAEHSFFHTTRRRRRIRSRAADPPRRCEAVTSERGRRRRLLTEKASPTCASAPSVPCRGTRSDVLPEHHGDRGAQRGRPVDPGAPEALPAVRVERSRVGARHAGAGEGRGFPRPGSHGGGIKNQNKTKKQNKNKRTAVA